MAWTVLLFFVFVIKKKFFHTTFNCRLTLELFLMQHFSSGLIFFNKSVQFIASSLFIQQWSVRSPFKIPREQIHYIFPLRVPDGFNNISEQKITSPQKFVFKIVQSYEKYLLNHHHLLHFTCEIWMVLKKKWNIQEFGLLFWW